MTLRLTVEERVAYPYQALGSGAVLCDRTTGDWLLPGINGEVPLIDPTHEHSLDHIEARPNEHHPLAPYPKVTPSDA